MPMFARVHESITNIVVDKIIWNYHDSLSIYVYIHSYCKVMMVSDVDELVDYVHDGRIGGMDF